MEPTVWTTMPRSFSSSDLYSVSEMSPNQTTSSDHNCVKGEWVPYPSPLPDPTITENFTYPFNTTYPAWEIGLKTSAYIIAMAFAIFGNILVILTVALNKKLYSSTNFYLLNLAASDLCIGALNMWMHLIDGIMYSWPFGEPLCKFYPFLQMLWLTGSALFMTVIACERYVAILHPLRARLSKPYQHLIIMLAVWLVAIAVALPNIFVRQTQELVWLNYHQVWCDEVWARKVKGEDSRGTCLYEYPLRQAYYTTTVVVTYVVPILFMTAAYARIMHQLRTRRLPGEQVEKVIQTHQRTNRQVIRMLIVVLLAFTLCWTPQEIFVFIEVNWPDTMASVPAGARYVLIYIAYFNSSLNPLLYAGFNIKLRGAFYEMIHCKKRPQSTNKIYPSTNGHVNTASSTF